jgi:hypothetical protein
MKARTLANVGCWLLVSSLVVADALYLLLRWHLRSRFVWSGNTYTDPIACILSYFTPVAVLGVIGLAILWRYGLATKRGVIFATAITFCFTLGPLAYGLWLWHTWNMPFELSYWAWWL